MKNDRIDIFIAWLFVVMFVFHFQSCAHGEAAPRRDIIFKTEHPLLQYRKAIASKPPPLPKAILEHDDRKVMASKILTSTWPFTAIGFHQVKKDTKCGSPVVVAIVDTGVDYTNPAFERSFWTNQGEVGSWTAPASTKDTGCRDKSCNGIDDDGNGYIDDVIGWDFVHNKPFPFDEHGHGTHVAGIVDTVAKVGRPEYDDCQRVKLMALKYYSSGAGFNNLANTVSAFKYAIKQGAQIINYSGGGDDPAASEKQAIEEAGMKNILVVAAAGNDGHLISATPYYPASYNLPNIISVASINKNNEMLPSSNFGPTVDIAAPGLSVVSTLPDKLYGTMSGTSQATPFVTGTAAFVHSQGVGVLRATSVKAFILRKTRPLSRNVRHKLTKSGSLWLPSLME